MTETEIMKERIVPSQNKIRIRFAIMGIVILAVVIFFVVYSGLFSYIFNFEGYVRSLDIKRYSLGEVTLSADETKEFVDTNGEREYSISISEVKKETDEVSVKVTIVGSSKLSSGKLVRSSAIKNGNENYIMEVTLSNGSQNVLLALKTQKVSRARAEYVYCTSSFSLNGDEIVKIKNLVMNEYKR